MWKCKGMCKETVNNQSKRLATHVRSTLENTILTFFIPLFSFNSHFGGSKNILGCTIGKSLLYSRGLYIQLIILKNCFCFWKELKWKHKWYYMGYLCDRLLVGLCLDPHTNTCDMQFPTCLPNVKTPRAIYTRLLSPLDSHGSWKAGPRWVEALSMWRQLIGSWDSKVVNQLIGCVDSTMYLYWFNNALFTLGWSSPHPKTIIN
jgi:hypothetical protein